MRWKPESVAYWAVTLMLVVATAYVLTHHVRSFYNGSCP